MCCPKCGRKMAYERPSFAGDTGSMRCYNCGSRIWDKRPVVMPDIPPVEDGRNYQANAANLAKAREVKLAGIAERRNVLLLEMARLDKEARLAS